MAQRWLHFLQLWLLATPSLICLYLGLSERRRTSLARTERIGCQALLTLVLGTIASFLILKWMSEMSFVRLVGVTLSLTLVAFVVLNLAAFFSRGAIARIDEDAAPDDDDDDADDLRFSR